MPTLQNTGQTKDGVARAAVFNPAAAPCFKHETQQHTLQAACLLLRSHSFCKLSTCLVKHTRVCVCAYDSK